MILKSREKYERERERESVRKWLAAEFRVTINSWENIRYVQPSLASVRMSHEFFHEMSREIRAASCVREVGQHWMIMNDNE